MKETMRYITVEEHKLYQKLVNQFNIKGYSPPASLRCDRPNLEIEGFSELKQSKKERKDTNW